MSTTIYIANLPEDTDNDQIHSLFGQYGDVLSVNLIRDNESGKLAGYGFVEMAEEAALEAIHALSGKDFNGHNLQVNQARGRSSDR